jgi:antitoxin (DNA-binding transcriptional repressor) of toxin-antitoxin stability system
MTRYSIAEAKESLPTLVDKALAGEVVTLTRDGEAVVELRPSAQPAAPRPLNEAEWRRMRARRAARGSLGQDSVSIIRAMRDHECHWA